MHDAPTISSAILYPVTEVPGLSTFCEFAHLSSWLIDDGFCTKYHVLCGGYISVFCMSLIPIMIQNIFIMGSDILIDLSRIMFTHGTLKLQTIQLRKGAIMAEINVFNHKSSSTPIPNEMVCWRNWLVRISINSNQPQILVFTIKKGFKWNWSICLATYAYINKLLNQWKHC